MKTPESLGWKILLMFLVNLAVLGGGIVLFLGAQFNIGFNTLLSRSTEARLEGVARPIASTINEAPIGEWSRILEETTAAWREKGVQISLYRNDGSWLAGDRQEIPQEVSEALRDQANRIDLSSELRWWRPEAEEEEEAPKPTANANTESAAVKTVPLLHEPFPKFMLISRNPRIYWAGVHLRGVPEDPPLSVTLLLASHSMRGGGLFIDYVRWLWLAFALMLISFLLWTPFVYRITRALGLLTRNAEMIAQGQFAPPPDLKRRDELGRLNRAHQYMSDRLEGLLASQKRFLGDTAHELLSPLARLDATLSILEQRSVAADRDYMRRALAEVSHLSAMVHDLLSFTRTGLRKTVQLRPVQLKEVVRNVIEKEAALNGKVVEDIAANLYVRAEPESLTMALANVVRNAIRYAGAQGPVGIHAHLDSHGEVVILITDEGPGVPEDALPRLFDPFYRPEVSRTPESGGTGLGLAIVKSCVEACQGRVSVSNRHPHGLQVEIRLHPEKNHGSA